MIDFSRFNSIFELTAFFNSEERCKRAIRDSRWEKDDIVCPFCGRHHCYTRKDGSYRCPECGRNFSVLVNTIFENTKIPLVKWFIAMYLISCHKKGISSVQLATDIHVTQKTAWYILHKVRTLFEQNDTDNNIHGVVECDEMYLGGRETNKHECKRTEKTQGRSTKTKTPIFGMAMVWKEETVNAKGETVVRTHTRVNAIKVADARATTLIPIIEQFVVEGSTIVTDELSAYNAIDASRYAHRCVRHGEKEFSVNGYSTNGIEGFWGHFKRMVFGTYHFVSKVYLQRYIDEAVYRFNTREMKECERFGYMFRRAIGNCYYEDVRIAA